MDWLRDTFVRPGRSRSRKKREGEAKQQKAPAACAPAATQPGCHKPQLEDAAVASAGGSTLEDTRPQKEAWNEELVRKLPYTIAILSSDACQVLQHSLGTEPEAAQLLHDVLNSSAESTLPGALPPSILSRLLGPQLEAEALQALALGRPWKGTIALCPPLPVGMPSDVSFAPAGPAEAYPSCVRADLADVGFRAPSSLGLPLERSMTQTRSISSEHSVDPVNLGIGLATCPDIFVGGDEPRSHSTVDARSSKAGREAGIHRAPRKNKSFNLGPRRASFLCMPEEDIDKLLLSGSPTEDCSRTRSLLKGISSKAQHTPEKAGSSSPRTLTSISQCLSDTRKLEVSGAPSDASEGLRPHEPAFFLTSSGAFEDERLVASDEMERASLPFLGAHGARFNNQASQSRAAGFCGDSAACYGTVQMPQTSTFDISISKLRGQTEDSPILMSIYNSSEHGQARFVLSSLAESQLELLADIMPEHAIQFLAMERREAIPENIAKLAHSHKDATILFMDLCGFTAFSKSVEPVQVMVFLNNLFSAFDQLTEECHVHKLETAGDCYIVSGGIMAPDPSPNGFATVLAEPQDPAVACKRVMDFAVKALQVASKVSLPGSDSPISLRVGIHTGDCVSGLIGTKIPKFSCFGDAMNVASRMETTGVPGRIHVSESTWKLLQHGPWVWEPTGGVEVKGKGCMSTYLWSPSSDSSPGQLPSPSATPQASSSQYQCIHSACSLLQHVLTPGNSSCPLPRIALQIPGT